jgi:hypothetical protein
VVAELFNGMSETLQVGGEYFTKSRDARLALYHSILREPHLGLLSEEIDHRRVLGIDASEVLDDRLDAVT